MDRRRIGLVLLIAGGLLFSFAGGRYAIGAAAQDEARRDWDASAARSAVDDARAFALRDRGGSPAHGSPVARLVIPKIGLDEIVLEGIDDAAMNGGPGHFPGSPLPGERGNSIVSAHRDRHFKNLGALAVGDTIVTETGLTETKWVVTRRRVVDKDSPVLFPTRTATLTLTTCWPIQYFGTAPERLILTARPLPEAGK